MRRILTCGIILALSLLPALAEKKSEMKVEEKREKIDQMAKETLDGLLEQNAAAKTLYGKASGYAVFDNLKLSLGLSGGGGSGVAVDKSSGKRTYMKMGTGGVGLGLGGQKYQLVFLFQTAE